MAAAFAALAGCTPHTALLSSLVPEGTVPILLSHLEGGMEQDNLKRVAELESRKDWDGLVKFAEENLAKEPNNSDWWYVAGYAHTQAGRHERAIQCYSQMVRLVPDDMLGWYELAQAYRDAKQPLHAIQTLNQAHLVRKGTPQTYFMLGESFSDLDRYLPASEAYREAVELKADYASAWFGLGRAYSRLNRNADFDRALKALERLDPKQAKALAEMRPASR